MARKNGNRGSIYLAGSVSKIADSHTWEFEEMQEVLDASIKGEPFRRYVASDGHSRVRIQSYTSSTSATPLTSGMNNNMVTAAGVGTRVQFILDMEDPTTVVQGSGYIVRSQIHVGHDGLITDEIEIEVDGALTTVA